MRNVGEVLMAVLLAGGCSQGNHEPPAEAVDLNNQGYRAFQQGNLDGALLLINDAIKLDAKFVGAHVNKAAILDKQGKRAEAVAVLERLVKLEPSRGDGYVALGVLLEKMGRKPEAEGHYARALRLFSKQLEQASAEEKADIEVNMAAAQYLSGDTQGAAARLDAVLTANPKMEKARAYKERVNSGQREVFLNGP